MVDIGTLMATISTDLAPLRAGLVDAEKAMNDASVKMSNSLNKVTQSTVEVGRAMAATGKAMSKSLTLPILGAASASFKFYKDFEHYLSRIEGLVGIAREQVYAWGQELITMGPKLAKSPKDLADALYFITSAGMRGADAMEVLEGTRCGRAALALIARAGRAASIRALSGR